MTRARLEAGAALALSAIALAVRIPGLGMPLIEWHGWRQTMTAYTALLFHERGIDLFHAQLPIFGPPFEVPMEFPAVQAAASVVMDAGVEPDLAMRLTHLALFFLSAGLLYGLVRHVAGPVAALAALACFLFLPTNILWSRAGLVEYGGTAGAIAFLWAGIAWRERRRWPLFAVALVAGTLGILVKPTTPIFWALPLVLWRLPGEPAGVVGWIRARLDPALAALCVAPTAIALAWTSYADSVKATQEAAAFLTSAATRTFYYASLADRFDPVIWKRTWLWISSYVVGEGVLPFFAAGLIVALRSARPAFWGGVLLSALVPFAIFYGGYYKHDYYWASVTPQVAAFVGLALFLTMFIMSPTVAKMNDVA
ncbi:MAG TPA: glycosyltransferase family 39 protein, partial [Candidatus Limnocylindria bacterium]|nr:glycosyltransferase family 39 protein [Candidatus Limnocylindria bacterium]